LSYTRNLLERERISLPCREWFAERFELRPANARRLPQRSGSGQHKRAGWRCGFGRAFTPKARSCMIDMICRSETWKRIG